MSLYKPACTENLVAIELLKGAIALFLFFDLLSYNIENIFMILHKLLLAY